MIRVLGASFVIEFGLLSLVPEIAPDHKGERNVLLFITFQPHLNVLLLESLSRWGLVARGTSHE